MRDLPPLWTDEKPVSFDPVQTTFLQKLVRAKALSASISVKKEDFFAAVVYLDAFAELVAGRPTLLDDVGVIVSDLEARHPYLDPDLELIVRYSAVHVQKDLGGERFFRKATLREVGKRRDVSDGRPVVGPVAVDLFHEAVGRRVADCFTAPVVRDALPGITSRNDLRLALVCDQVLACSGPPDALTTDAIARGAWSEAALAALQPFVALRGGESLAAYVEAAHARLEGR